MQWIVERVTEEVFGISYGPRGLFCSALTASIDILSKSGVQGIESSEFVNSFCTFVREYLDSTFSLRF